MPDKPTAEVRITRDTVRRLLVAQASAEVPDAAALPLRKVAEGWDSELWRVGSDLAARLPRRAIAAPLVLNEQRALAAVARRLEASGVGVPAPVVHGRPGEGFPWPWSVVPWFEGERGLDVGRADRAGWAPRLADALGALHAPAPKGFPRNPFRGVPLADRADAVAQRLTMLREQALVPVALLDGAEEAWRRGVAAAPWELPAVWIHGDLHPGNVIAHGGRLVALIDFGDVTGGDPAYDLAIGWLAFDAAGRSAFRAAADRYDAATWVRARAWAAAVSLMLVAHSDDDPDYAQLGHDGLAELASE